MSKKYFSRRDVLKAASAAVVLSPLSPMVLPAQVVGRDGKVAPSNKITLGIIGAGGRGRHDLRRFLLQPDVQFLAIADVQRDRRELCKNMSEKEFGVKECTLYRDFRELLLRNDIDAVLVATGDHWHAHASIYAAQAGKDVYSEKPCAITIDLCRQLARTMKRYGTIFQGGVQRRSLGNFKTAVDLARNGKLGKLKEVHAAIYRLEVIYNWLPAQPLPKPDEIDWDLWLGPSPWRPYNVDYVRGRWRAHYDFDSGSKFHDWGAHTVDLCQWAVGADGSAPVKFWAENQTIYGRYDNGVKLVARTANDGWLGLGNCAVRFEGEEGWVETGDSGRIAVSPDSLRSELAKDFVIYGKKNGGTHGEDPETHIRNFLDCVKTREQPVCNADVVCSTHIACHAAAMSWLLKRELNFDPKTDNFINDDQANRLKIRSWREPWIV
ncbi:MAG: Gfo/Idh/MocA family oxidoreductase [Planctomycetaceae bacterium]|jgi:predicted dehydrogenase|nr:Gfo/Idh/MocA family oxidoreductase [Planctomycetaceae bacterium]